MTPSWWYLPGADGTHYNWAKHPTFECPNADTVTYTAAEREGEEGTWVLQRDAISAAAAAIGADAILLAKLLRRCHHTSVGGRLRVHGVLTNRCAVCGATMTRKGYRAWITAPGAGAGAQRTTTRTTWHRTRREAAAWARHERDRCARGPEGRSRP